MTGRRSLSGQALVFLLPLLFALAAAVLWAYEAGRGVTEKRRLVDATDAAALSAAAFQARTLDFDAYTNRAIVANEAVIAQSVSLRSFSSYLNVLLPRAAAVTQWVPLLDAAMATLAQSWAQVDQVVQPSLAGLETVTSLAAHDLAASQRLMHLGTLEAVPALVRETLQSADPNYRLTTGGEAMLARWAFEWVEFASFYGGAWRWRPADVVTRSLDGFTTARNFTLRPVLGTSLVRLERRGGTDLLDFETWRALDTFSVHRRRNLIFGSVRERDVLAWGGAQAGSSATSRGTHGGSYAVNPRAARSAEETLGRPSGYLGLPSAYDLSRAQRADFDPPRLAIRTRAGAESSAYAESVASVHYARPAPRADRSAELPNLYAPYWRARLVAARAAERLSLATLDGTPNWLALVPR